MQSLGVAKKLLPGVLFLLLATFASLPPCVAVTIEEIYDDDTGEGFKDETDLTQAEKNLISPSGNDAQTLGEARTKAFEHTTSLLESTLTNTNTIRISARFVFFSGQEDSNNPGECLLTSGTTTVAMAGPTGYGYPRDRLDEGDTNRMGLGTAYPYALYEATSGTEFNAQNADIRIRFSKCIPFYYGFTGSMPANHIDFVQLALHEIMHGMGFLQHVESDGDFSTRTITIYSTVNGITTTREATIKSRTIYDEQLHSETDDDLLINLTNSQRATAITSGTGLLWDGTDDGRNSCSYGQRMAELKTSSAKAQDGKPLLHAPSTYDSAGSVIHTHANTEDIMEAFVPAPRNMDLTLGMLKDMGWSISADGFPPDCEPTGIVVTADPGLVTTESGGEAKFEVSLKSKPEETVVIPLTSSDVSEGTPDSLELTFTPQNWETAQEVTVTGADDDFHDGSQDYFITLEKAESDDRFYDGFTPEPQIVFLRNDDNDLPDLSIEDSDAEEGSSMDFTVTLSPQSVQTVTVGYSITDITAQEGSDYTASPASGTLMFISGQTRKTIRVRAIDDDLDESGDEIFTVTLNNPQNARLDQSSAIGLIKDNDEATLQINNSSAGEGAGSINFTVRLDPRSVQTVTAEYSITGNTAQEGSDYEAAPSNASITFAPEQSRNTISVSVIDDGERELNETFTVTLSNPQNAVIASNGGTATGTIRDNDQPPPPPPPAETQVEDNIKPPPAEQQPVDNTQQPPPDPTPSNTRPPSGGGVESGGGGCAVASGADYRTESAAVNLLLFITVLFSVFLRKTCLTN